MTRIGAVVLFVVGGSFGSALTWQLTRPEPGETGTPDVVEGPITLVSRDKDAIVVDGESFGLESDFSARLHEGERVRVGFVTVEGEQVVVYVRPAVG